MNAYKIELLVLDFEQVGAAGIREMIEEARYPNHAISPSVMALQVADIGAWSDEHPLNHRDKQAAEFARLFAHPAPAVSEAPSIDTDPIAQPVEEAAAQADGGLQSAMRAMTAYQQSVADALAAAPTAQPKHQAYRIEVGWECAKMEPHPDGEWYRRADVEAQPTLEAIRQTLVHPEHWHGAVTPPHSPELMARYRDGIKGQAQPTPPDDERGKWLPDADVWRMWHEAQAEHPRSNDAVRKFATKIIVATVEQGIREAALRHPPVPNVGEEPLDVEFKRLADTILQATTNGARLEALRGMAELFDRANATRAAQPTQAGAEPAAAKIDGDALRQAMEAYRTSRNPLDREKVVSVAAAKLGAAIAAAREHFYTRGRQAAIAEYAKDVDDLRARLASAGTGGQQGNAATQAPAQAPARVDGEMQRPTDDRLWDETLRDRDTYHEWADKLAYAIGKRFGVDVGEHSNQNLPWAEALNVIEDQDLLPVQASDAAKGAK